jgi:hypothetical protein
MATQQKEKLIILVSPTGETPSRDGGPYVPMCLVLLKR